MRYGMIGRSSTDYVVAKLHSHERVFRSFAVPFGSFFNDPHNKVESGPLVESSPAKYFLKFNIELQLEQHEVEFILIDTYKDVKCDMYYDHKGNFFPYDKTIMNNINEESVKARYGWLPFGDMRYLELMQRSMKRFADLLNSKYPAIKLIILDTYATNTYSLDSSQQSVKSFAPFVRFGSEDNYYSFANYRLYLGTIVARQLRSLVNNSILVRSPISLISAPPSEISPTHFSNENYTTIAADVDQALDGTYQESHFDMSFELMKFAFLAQQANQRLNEWIGREVLAMRSDMKVVLEQLQKLRED